MVFFCFFIFFLWGWFCNIYCCSFRSTILWTGIPRLSRSRTGIFRIAAVFFKQYFAQFAFFTWLLNRRVYTDGFQRTAQSVRIASVDSLDTNFLKKGWFFKFSAASFGFWSACFSAWIRMRQVERRTKTATLLMKRIEKRRFK